MPPCGYAVMQMFMYVCHDVNAPLWVCHDVNVCLGACYDAMMRMFPWEYTIMRMSHWCMPWCKCFLRVCNDANALLGMQWMQMPPCGYTMTRMLWCKHNLFKNSFYFQNEASTTPETKIFSNSIYYEKSSSFWLKAPKKNWWLLLGNLRMGHLLEI